MIEMIRGNHRPTPFSSCKNKARILKSFGIQTSLGRLIYLIGEGLTSDGIGHT